jgi:DNA modification methylase
MSVCILIGDCRDRMKELPDNSVHCCVSSPPYWGLRDYGIPPSIWGGDAACAHLWGAELRRHKGGPHGDGVLRDGGRAVVGAQAAVKDIRAGAFCQHCGAWCGCLGLEPTPELFVAHLVEVFAEVHRVLRPEGTVWMNLGDSYYTGAEFPLRITERQAAWLAALIDGEGCIQAHRQTPAAKHNSVDTFQVDVGVGMVDECVVRRAHEITGVGSLTLQKRGVWDWSVRGQQAAVLLRAVYPHLILKRRQAALGIMLAEDLAVRRFGRGNPATAEAIEYRHQIKQAISDLNQRRGSDFPIREPAPRTLGLKPKDLCGTPWRVAEALQEQGWWLRADIIWHKANPMPESVSDRPTKAHEYLFLFAKSPRYYYDAEAIKEPVSGTANARGSGVNPKARANAPGAKQNESFSAAVRGLVSERNKRSVWTVPTQPFPEAHFATFPPALIEPCILAGTSPQACEQCGAPWQRVVAPSERYAKHLGQGKSFHDHEADLEAGRLQTRGENRQNGPRDEDGITGAEYITKGWAPSCACEGATGSARCVVLDPFGGAATTGLVADRLGRDAVLCELNPAYAAMGRERIQGDAPLLAEVAHG